MLRNTLLFIVARNGELNILRYLVNELSTDVNLIGDSECNTALTLACAEEDLATMRCLVLELGADVNLGVGEDGVASPLFVAVRLRQAAVVQCLVEELGADVNLATKAGDMPLFIAAEDGSLGILQCLIEGGARIPETGLNGENIWNVLNPEGADDAALSSLLRVMVLISNPLLGFWYRLKTQHVLIVSQGNQLRAQLPGHIEQQRAAVVAHCPLPAVILPIVARCGPKNTRTLTLMHLTNRYMSEQ
jgi:hypothetical protein